MTAQGSSAGAAGPVSAPEALGETLVFPASFAQRRLWFLDRLSPGGSTYNMAYALRVRGDVDVRALERALAEIVRRHEVLRTTFAAPDGFPVQIVHDGAEFALAVRDAASEGARDDAAVAALLADEARKPFDLARGPLFRATLLRVGETEHLLVVTVHHIVFDGWSGPVLSRELGQLYDAFRSGRPSPLPELPLQYADFAVWQHGGQPHGQRPAPAEQLRYWLAQLADAPAVSEFPTDRARTSEQHPVGETYVFTVPSDLTERLRSLARSEHATLFMVLLAAFQALLARCSGQKDVCVGTPVAGRTDRDLEPLIGLFVNTLVMRGDLSGNPSFRELVRRTRDATLAALHNQDTPFEQLVEELRPDRSLSHAPIFQTMIALQNVPRSRIPLAGLDMEVEPIETGAARLDLFLNFVEDGVDGRRADLEGIAEYNSELFDRATIVDLVARLLRLLGAVAADPDRPVERVEILSPEERRRILVDWNDTDSPLPSGRCLHDAFRERALAQPEAEALRWRGTSISYRELEARANGLAHRLRALGVGPDIPVGLCVERSPAFPVGALAILKAGGAYVPLDPAQPAARLATIAADAGLPVVVTASERGVAPPEGPIVVDVDAAGTADEPPRADTTPDHLAYLVYTSGSTGVPKGVMGTHRATQNRVLWMDGAYPFEPGEVSAHKTALGFVDGVAELFSPLLAGVPLVLVPREIATDPGLLVTALHDEGVTRLMLVPSLLTAILEHDDLDRRLHRVRLWTVGGEPTPPALVRRFHEALPGRVLMNLYGLSETAADSTYHETRPDEPEDRPLAVGRPIANTQVYLLDGHLEPVPPGVEADVYIGGDGVARGYLRRPALTADRFVPDPFGGRVGARLYATGDRARHRRDGTIEYAGRRDQQVKVRGHRIELGEIEVVLTGHPAVRHAAVALARGGDALAAYVVLEDERPATATELTAYLGERLPDYMLPSSYTTLELLPLNANGKIDRAALPEPAAPAEGRPYAPPATPVEEAITRIWAELLAVERVGMDDNFFELGGHSLTAMRVTARIEREFGVTLPLVRLFDAPTVRACAAAVDEALAREVEEMSDEDVRAALADLGASPAG